MADSKKPATPVPKLFGVVQKAVRQKDVLSGSIEMEDTSKSPSTSQASPAAVSVAVNDHCKDKLVIKEDPSGAATLSFRKACKAVQQSTLVFLGLTNDWADTHQDAWRHERLRLARRQYKKDSLANSQLEQLKSEVKKRRRGLRQQQVFLQVCQEEGFKAEDLNTEQRLSHSAEGDAVDWDSDLTVQSHAVCPNLDEEQAEDEDSDSEPSKMSVAAITLNAVTKAVGKWKSKVSERPVDDSDGGALRENESYVTFEPAPRVRSIAAPEELNYVQSEAVISKSKRAPLIKHGTQPEPKRKAGGRTWLSGLRQKVKILEDSQNDYRPYFTYWVSSVQFTVLLLSLCLFPWAPYGVGLKNITGEVLTTSLSLEVIEYEEPASVWLGSTQASLVALGAKFTPCMRPERLVQEGVTRQQQVEATTGCCIRHDYSGCVQTVVEQCSVRLSRYVKWTEDKPGPDDRLSGPVCGQDPRYCTAPASVAPNVWPDDITMWPVCLASNTTTGRAGTSSSTSTSSSVALARGDTSYDCEVIGRPCCVGIHGECHITTREHCDFLHGHFHDEASLCAQVSCLSDVCRMLAFLDPEVPDQIYRVFISIFVHSGVAPFALTMILHFVFLRNLEKFAGQVRVAIIYITSGITGNLASAIFVPNRPEAGPSGCLAGVFACLFVIYVVDVKDKLRSSLRVTFEWGLFLLLWFAVGLLPAIDNYANVFGFLMGGLLSAGILPHVGHIGKHEPSPGDMDEHPDVIDGNLRSYHRRVIVVCVSLFLVCLLLVSLLIVFYFVPFECHWCGYFDCVPFTPDFCAEQQTSFERHRIIT